jgi:hypothetical protein
MEMAIEELGSNVESIEAKHNVFKIARQVV